MRIRFQTTCAVCLAASILLGACDQQPSYDTRFRGPDPHPPAKREEKLSFVAERSSPPGKTENSSGKTENWEPTQHEVRVKVSQFQMGMMVHLTVWARSREEGQLACKVAFRRIHAINMMMSDYEPTSELSRLCRQAGRGPMSVGKDLFEVLSAARQLAQWSDGLYDPTAAPVIRLWRTARTTRILPDATARRKASQLVGYKKLVLDARGQTAELLQPGMLLDLGSIAKGYAGDQALRVLRQKGITRAAFEGGGDKVLGDPPYGAKGWTVELPDPKMPSRQLANCAVSVSGSAVQYLQINGRRYSHVVDPRTAMGIESQGTCMVVAAHGMVSDPLATLGTLMPRDEFERLLKQHFPTAKVEWFSESAAGSLDSTRVPPP